MYENRSNWAWSQVSPILFGVNSSGTHGSVRQGRGASHVSKWQMCITRIEVFPCQSEASIRFLFLDQACFSTSLLNLMYLSIFVRVAKNLALYPSEKSASGIFIRCALSIMSTIFDWCLPQDAEMADDAHRSKISKLCLFCGKIASSNTSRPRNRYDSSCYTTPHFVTQNLFTRETCIKLENSSLWQFLTKNFHFGITERVNKYSFYKTIWFWRAFSRKIVLRLENMSGSDCALKFLKTA